MNKDRYIEFENGSKLTFGIDIGRGESVGITTHLLDGTIIVSRTIINNDSKESEKDTQSGDVRQISE